MLVDRLWCTIWVVYPCSVIRCGFDIDFIYRSLMLERSTDYLSGYRLAFRCEVLSLGNFTNWNGILFGLPLCRLYSIFDMFWGLHMYLCPELEWCILQMEHGCIYITFYILIDLDNVCFPPFLFWVIKLDNCSSCVLIFGFWIWCAGHTS